MDMHFCMDWKHTNFDWNRARAFLVTVEEGSYSAAARALGVAQPTLGRQVSALEEELGLVLLERVGNKLSPTPEGLALAGKVREMNEAAIGCALLAAGQAQSIEGLVRIAASEPVAAYVLPAMVEEMLSAHPGLRIELVVSNATSDLRRREADIAIRHVRPQGADLVARLIKEQCRAYLYASSGYLRRINNPASPQSLMEQGRIIGFDDTPALQNTLAGLGLQVPQDRLPVFVENQLVQWEMAKRGMGMCIMPEEVGEKEPGMERVLPGQLEGVAYPTWLVSHRELRTSQRIRVVFDLLTGMLKHTLSEPPPR